MFKIEVKGLSELQADVDDLIKSRIPKITAIALTATAKALKENTVKQLSIVFNQPTPWTLGGVYYMYASPDNLNAYVWFKDDAGKGTPAVKYLWPEVHGGPRNLKRYELALQRFGVLPGGYYTVPGKGVKLDRFGNIPTGLITELLTGVGALVGMSDTTFYGKLGGYKKRKSTTANYFVVKVKHGGLVPGIWERLPETGTKIRGYKGATARQKGKTRGEHYYEGLGRFGHSVIQGRKVRPILIFVKSPQYGVRFPFYQWAQDYVDVEFPKTFNRLAAETLEFWKVKKGQA